MIGDDEFKVVERRDLTIAADRLLGLSSYLAFIGVIVAFCSFGSVVAAAALISKAVGTGVFTDRISDGLSYSDKSFVQLAAAMTIFMALASLAAIVLRDRMMRSGQVLSDILVEEFETTKFDDRLVGKLDIRVKVAIRTFRHQSSLPLVSAASSGSIYVVLAVSSLFAAVFILGLVG